ncbi:hypothetical protein CFE70_010158 [Pyrenophora teres f. teres 0-1]
MPAQSSNSSPGLNYWYGSGGSLPDALEGLPPGSSNPRLMRRASEAVVQASGIQICPRRPHDMANNNLTSPCIWLKHNPVGCSEANEL